MGDTQTTSTNTSQSASPAVQNTVDLMANKIGEASGWDYPVFNKSLYPGMSDLTRSGIGRLTGAVDNQDYKRGVQGGIGYAGQLADGTGPSLTESSLMGVAQGNHFGQNAPGYERLRSRAMDDASTSINQTFGNSGRFGSGGHVESLGEGLFNASAGLDYQNYQNDIARQERALAGIEGTRQQGVNNAFMGQQMLPGLMSASALPQQMMIQAGGLLDADAAAKLQGEQDLFMRQKTAPYTKLGTLSSTLAGTAPFGGTTSTSTQPAPNPFLGLLGAGLSFL